MKMYVEVDNANWIYLVIDMNSLNFSKYQIILQSS